VFLLPATVNCEDAEYTNVILPWGIAAMVVFPVGVNLLYATLLFWNRAEIHSEKIGGASSGSAVAFLHKPFTPSCFCWEVVDSVRGLSVSPVV
jgi:hypothetical protein